MGSLWLSVLPVVMPLQGVLGLWGAVTQGDAVRRCRGALPRAGLFGPFGAFVFWLSVDLWDSRSDRGISNGRIYRTPRPDEYDGYSLFVGRSATPSYCHARVVDS